MCWAGPRGPGPGPHDLQSRLRYDDVSLLADGVQSDELPKPAWALGFARPFDPAGWRQRRIARPWKRASIRFGNASSNELRRRFASDEVHRVGPHWFRSRSPLATSPRSKMRSALGQTWARSVWRLLCTRMPPSVTRSGTHQMRQCQRPPLSQCAASRTKRVRTLQREVATSVSVPMAAQCSSARHTRLKPRSAATEARQLPPSRASRPSASPAPSCRARSYQRRASFASGWMPRTPRRASSTPSKVAASAMAPCARPASVARS